MEEARGRWTQREAGIEKEDDKVIKEEEEGGGDICRLRIIKVILCFNLIIREHLQLTSVRLSFFIEYINIILFIKEGQYSFF